MPAVEESPSVDTQFSLLVTTGEGGVRSHLGGLRGCCGRVSRAGLWSMRGHADRWSQGGRYAKVFGADELAVHPARITTGDVESFTVEDLCDIVGVTKIVTLHLDRIFSTGPGKIVEIDGKHTPPPCGALP